MNTLRPLRNSSILWVTTIVLACFSDAAAQTSYTVTDLGILRSDWNLGCAMSLNNHGWTITQNGLNFNQAPPVTARDTINIGELKIDLGSLGGENTWMNWGGINDRGEAVGMSETSVLDPDGEDVCGFGTGRECRPFLWQDGHMSALPTLGGNNGSASDINDRGQIAGTAETTIPDSGCSPSHPAKVSLPVLWENGKVQPLPTLGSDPDGLAFAINDEGQAVGQSANCRQTIIHAVFWENGTAFPLPDLGAGSIAQGINHQGQIVGIIGSADTEFGALWQNGVLTNLGTLPGDFASIATGINNRGQVVGSTLDSNFNWAHGFIWQDGVMTDLNTLLPADSNLFITMANKINERGQISGMATVRSGPHAGDVHAILATPVNARVGTSVADVTHGRPNSNFSPNVGKKLLQRLGRSGQ